MTMVFFKVVPIGADLSRCRISSGADLSDYQLIQTKSVCKYLSPSLTHYFLLRFPIWIYSSDDHDYYGLPIHGNTGSKIGIDAGGPVVTPDTRSFDPDPVREQSCIDLLERVLPSVSNITKTSPCNMKGFFFSCKKMKISPEKI